MHVPLHVHVHMPQFLAQKTVPTGLAGPNGEKQYRHVLRTCVYCFCWFLQLPTVGTVFPNNNYEE